jgi:hypothetical protein
MTKPSQLQSILFLVFGLGLLAATVVSLVIFVSLSLYGSTPKDALTYVEGFSENVWLIRGRNNLSNSIEFSVDGFNTTYSSGKPKFREVREAVISGRRIRVGLWTRHETLYELGFVDGEPILSWSEVVEHEKDVKNFIPIIAYCTFVLGAWLVWHSRRLQQRDADWRRQQNEGKIFVGVSDSGKDLTYWMFSFTGLTSILLYGILIGMNFNSWVQARMVELLGTQPLELPVELVGFVIQTTLFFPFPWFFWHLAWLILPVATGAGESNVELTLTTGQRRPNPLWSAAVCFGGVFYLIVLLLLVGHIAVNGI